MHRLLQMSLFALWFGVSTLPLSAVAQDRIQPPATRTPLANPRDVPSQLSQPAGIAESNASRSAVTIGGPFGVVIGGGHGVRFGGPNGAQFGGGVGARFGGRSGVQFGGGEGVRIGPSTVSASPDDGPADAAADLTIPPSRSQSQIAIHHPPSSRQSLHVRVNDQDAEIPPGQAISVSGQRRVSVQIVNANGRIGPRRSLSPGNYISRDTRRGWTLVHSDAPIESAPTEEASRLPSTLELNPPGFEQVPTPEARRDSSHE